MVWPMLRAGLALASISVLLACSSGKGRSNAGAAASDEAAEEEAISSAESVGAGAPGRGESAPSVSYEESAEGNWQKGEDAYADEEYLAAQRYYAYLKTKFPYSQYTLLAELRIGDCQYGRQRFLEAIDTFQNFVRMHPTHEKVPYAMFKVGMAYYNQIPTNFFLLPPAEEKDQAAVRDAERALRQYVDRFAGHENHKEASATLKEVREKLLAHERYVADFYKAQEKDLAYVGRLEVIHNEYADVGLDDRLLLEIAEVYARLGEAEKLKATVDELATKFPGSDRLGRARNLKAGPKPADATASN
jgi:outer membrane protein assembly factor BamD